MTDSGWDARLMAFGYEQQAKFDFYMVALAFTILGLAVQTSSASASASALLFELLGWLLLLVSGVAGISRLAWQPQVFQVMAVQSTIEDQVAALEKAMLEGRTAAYVSGEGVTKHAGEIISAKRTDLQQFKGRADDLVYKGQGRYKIHQRCFVAGLLSLAVARALLPASAILTALRTVTG